MKSEPGCYAHARPPMAGNLVVSIGLTRVHEILVATEPVLLITEKTSGYHKQRKSVR